MFDPSEVLILVPILNRPHLIPLLVKNVIATAPDVELLFIANEEDEESRTVAYEQAEMDVGCVFYPGAVGWAEKINAAARRYTQYRYLFCCADDVIFHPGWLDAVMTEMGRGFYHESNPHAVTTTRVVGTLDNLTSNVMAGDHATHFMVDRAYIDDPGGVIDEGPGSFLPTAYRHNYTDTEFIETAKARGAFAPSAAVVEHAHFLAGAPFDETYRIGEDSKVADSLIFEQRRHLWEGGVK